MKKLILITFLPSSMLFSVPFTWSADFASGAATCQVNDFKTALAVWSPLAQRGNGRAQNFWGFMNDNEKGVLDDDFVALNGMALLRSKVTQKPNMASVFCSLMAKG